MAGMQDEFSRRWDRKPPHEWHADYSAPGFEAPESEGAPVGSTWRCKPPGREVVRIERVWMYSALGDPAELTVRAHPINGGRPLVAPVAWLREHYSRADHTGAPDA